MNHLILYSLYLQNPSLPVSQPTIISQSIELHFTTSQEKVNISELEQVAENNDLSLEIFKSKITLVMKCLKRIVYSVIQSNKKRNKYNRKYFQLIKLTKRNLYLALLQINKNIMNYIKYNEKFVQPKNTLSY